MSVISDECKADEFYDREEMNMIEKIKKMKKRTTQTSEKDEAISKRNLDDVGRKISGIRNRGTIHMVDLVKNSATQTTEALRGGANKVGEMGKKSWSAIALPFSGQKDLLKYLGELTESAATKYDKALDRTYLETHIDGAYHRLFDGGHDVISAWERVREAAGDDTLNEQIMGYVSALWKDMTTTQGLPFVTVPKDSFDHWVQQMEWIPGVDRAYLSDLISFDAMEIIFSFYDGRILCTQKRGSKAVGLCFK